MERRKKVETLYWSFLDLAGAPLAASILCAAQVVAEAVDRLDSRFAMGIRHGLFRSGASPGASIDIAVARIAEGLGALAGALDDLEGFGR
ncbi:MAG: hypothetical protein ISR62_03880 [Desulfobacteraceae bacterium]|nr:hypothetical protein [Desulfobacterales bacterium]MBL6967543.1 hypothetical protein [Desulfobacteraceae bacterium]